MSDEEDDIFKKKKPNKKKQQQQQQQQQQPLQQEEEVPSKALKVLYCQICTLPVEYCHLTKTAKDCKDWLLTAHPELHDKIYVPVQQEQKDVPNADQEKPAVEKAPEQETQPLPKKKKTKIKESEIVVIKVTQRTQKKFTTTINGLVGLGINIFELGIDLKETCKKMQKKFGCGAVIVETKIELQGDLSEELEEWLPKEFPQITDIDIKSTYKKEYVVEAVVGKKFENGEYLYLIKWEGYAAKYNTWEPIEHLGNILELVNKYNQELLTQINVDKLKDLLYVQLVHFNEKHKEESPLTKNLKDISPEIKSTHRIGAGFNWGTQQQPSEDIFDY